MSCPWGRTRIRAALHMLLALCLVPEAAAAAHHGAGLARQPRPPAACARVGPPPRSAPTLRAAEPRHLVWFTGAGDLRLHDHGGLHATAACDAACVPVFVLDDAVHLSASEGALRRLHSAVVGLDEELRREYGASLVFRVGCAERALCDIAREARATVCHVVEEDVTRATSAKQRAVRASLEKAGVEVREWCAALRPNAPWAAARATLPCLPATYTEYRRQARQLPLAQPRPPPPSLRLVRGVRSEGLPRVGSVLERSDQHSQRARRVARARAAFATTEPFDGVVSAWCTTASAREAVREYLDDGRVAFSGKYFAEAEPVHADTDSASDADADVDADADASLDVDMDGAGVDDAALETDGSALGEDGVGVLGEDEGEDEDGWEEADAATSRPSGDASRAAGAEVGSEAVDGDGGVAVAAAPRAGVVPGEKGAMPPARVAAAGAVAAGASAAESLPDAPLPPPSLYAAAAQWILPPTLRAPPGTKPGAPKAEEVAARLALREVAVRAFSPALTLGSLSPREVASATHAAAQRAASTRVTARSVLESQAWGRSDMGALLDVVEWREWHRLLARRDIEVQRRADDSAEATASPAPDTASAHGDPLARERPAFGFWRWGGQHLVRYAVWAGGDDKCPEDDACAPAADADTACARDDLVMLFVHGFGASCEQWARLARQLRLQLSQAGQRVPRMYAVDLLGFGHAEKPGLTYTQHLWEAQLVDFALEVMGAHPFVVVGNSIGGGLASGLASNLRKLCRGLVLCNTAGRLVEAAAYAREVSQRGGRTVGECTLAVRDDPGALGELYDPPPLGGQQLLDAFGGALILYLRPQVRSLLRRYYPATPDAVDEELAAAIVRDATDPGAANVIASGQKLPPQRSLNEVLSAEKGFTGPVLVPQGALDPLTGAKVSQARAAQLGTLRAGVTVAYLNAGHCPHDEVPDQVAQEMVKWWPSLEGFV